MSFTADFALQALLAVAGGVAFFLVGLRTIRSNRHHYSMIRRRTGGARSAAVGTVGHDAADADASVVHGMAVSRRNGRRVVVRNGKIAEDSIAAC
jgi:hypothetical protein